MKKMRIRVLGLFLIVLMILTSMPVFTIAADDIEVTKDERPPLIIDPDDVAAGYTDENGYLLYEDFSDSEGFGPGSAFASGITVGRIDNNNSAISVEDGRLKMVRDGSDIPSPIINFNIGGNRANVPQSATYQTAFEFDLEIAEQNQVNLRLQPEGSVWSDKTISLLYFNNGKNLLLASDGNGNSPNVANEPPKSVRVTLVTTLTGNKASSMYDLYLDGIMVANGFGFDHHNISRLTVRLEGNNTVYLDNLKVYRVGIEEETSTDERPPMAIDQDDVTNGYADENGYLLYEDFSDSEGFGPGSAFNSGITISRADNNNSTIAVEDGRLKMVRNSSDIPSPIINFNIGGNRANVPPSANYRTAFEFDLEFTEQNQVNLRLLKEGSVWSLKTITMLYFNNNQSALYATNGSETSKVIGVAPKTVNVTLVTTLTGAKETSKYDIYLDGVKMAGDFGFTDADISRLIVRLEQNNTVYLDNLKIYRVDMSDKERVDSEYSALVSSGFSGINGSEQSLVEEAFAYAPTDSNVQIKFSSNVPGLVNSNGTVNWPAGTHETTAATVTATVYIGTYEKSVSYDVMVAGEIVIRQLTEESGWDVDEYYAIFRAYTLTDKSFDYMVTLKAYDLISGELIDSSVMNGAIGPKTGNDEDDMIYGYIQLDGRNDGNTRIEFLTEKIEGTFIFELDKSASGWGGTENEVYTAVFPAYTTIDKTSEVYIIIAAYNGNEMVGCSFDGVTVPSKTGTSADKITGTLTVPDGVAGCTEVKAFVWEDMAGIKPVLLTKAN